MGTTLLSRPAIRQAVGVVCAVLAVVLLVPVSASAGVRVPPTVLDDGPTTMVVSGAVAGETSPQIATGASHTCALLTDGTVRCWGLNAYGQVGDGTTVDRLHPVQVLASGTAGSVPVVPLTGVTQIVTGGYHTCALLTEGTVRCWGANWSGQLGDGTTGAGSDKLNPVQVLASGTAGSDPAMLLTGVTQIAAGESHTCALLTEGTVRCWGANGSGQLGDGTTGDGANARLNPVQVLASGTAASSPLELGGATRIAAGWAHTCALLTDGMVRCWGWNFNGQLGDGTSGFASDKLNPVLVLASGTAASSPLALGGVTQIAIGQSHTCALLADGFVRCWGRNTNGQIGDGTITSSSHPVEVLASGTAASSPVALGGVTQIATGLNQTCARTDGTVRCWGRNFAGGLGDGTSGTDRRHPVQVLASGTALAAPEELNGVTQIAAGFFFTCALLRDGTVRCWGSNDYGELGDGTAGIGSKQLNPVRVLASGTAALAPAVFSVGVLTVPSGDVGASTVSLVCSSNVEVGAVLTCTVTGGDAGIDILWRAAYNPVFAEAGVTLDASGTGTFFFTVPAAALGQELTVELVEWTAPISLGVVRGPVPSSVPSGGGPVPVWSLLLAALVAFGLLRRGMHAEA